MIIARKEFYKGLLEELNMVDPTLNPQTTKTGTGAAAGTTAKPAPSSTAPKAPLAGFPPSASVQSVPAAAVPFSGGGVGGLQSQAASAQPQAETVEERVAALETVVHQLAASVSGPHWGPGAWLERVGARIKAAAKKTV